MLKTIDTNRAGDKVQLIDKNEYYLLYEIFNINKISPAKTDEKFIKMVKNAVLLKKKYKLHEDLNKKIEEKKLSNDEFIKIAKNNEIIETTTIENINDNNVFDTESVKLIYFTKESFSLITGKNNKVYLSKIKNINFNNLDTNDIKNEDYLTKTNKSIINDIQNSYNSSLNSVYKVKIFNETMERIKNYFR